MIKQRITILTTITCDCGADSLELSVGGEGLDGESPCRSPDQALLLAIDAARARGLTVTTADPMLDAEVFCSKCKPTEVTYQSVSHGLKEPCLHCGYALREVTRCADGHRGVVHEWPEGSCRDGSAYWQRCVVAHGGCGWEGAPYPPAKCCPESHDCPTNALRDDHCASPDRS